MDPRDLINKRLTKRLFITSKQKRRCDKCKRMVNQFTKLQQYSPEAGKHVSKTICAPCWHDILREGPSKHTGTPSHEFKNR